MELNGTADDRGRLARVLLAVGLAAVSIASLLKGKRLIGVLVGVGAVTVGYLTASESTLVAEDLVGTAPDDDEFHCAACGLPILPGQARGPNADHEIVHTACKGSAD